MGVGAGAIFGTLAISMVRDHALQGRVFIVVGLGSGLAMIIMGTANSPLMAVVGAVMAGATQATYMAISQALVQDIVPDTFRGRAMAIYTMMAAGHMAWINLGFGGFADSIGVRTLMVVPALMWMGIFILALFMLSDLQRLLGRERSLFVESHV